MFTARRYLIELGAAVALYAGLLVGSNLVDRAVHPTGVLRLAIALVPMLGVWPLMGFLWLVGQVVAYRRYR